ncbi:MAG: SRPBCC family protein [Planctomycetota bacterium]
MPTVVCSIETVCGVERAFEETHDYRKRVQWDRFIRRYEVLGEGAIERGTRVWVRAWNGLAMTVEYEAVKEPGVVGLVAMQMVDGPWFLRKFTGSWRFEAAGDGGAEVCRVTFRYGFVARWGWMTWPVGVVLRWEMGRRIEALRRHLDGVGHRSGHVPPGRAGG